MIRFGYPEIKTGRELCGGGATRFSDFLVLYSLKDSLTTRQVLKDFQPPF